MRARDEASRTRQQALGFEVPGFDDSVGIGSVGTGWVCVWIRSSSPGSHRVAFHDPASGQWHKYRFDVPASDARDGITSVRCELPVPRSGKPTRFEYEVLRDADDFVLGAGQFETAPATEQAAPDEFSFLVVSCHQPFDDDGKIIHESLQMLRALETVVKDHAVKGVLMIGDQMYSDMPEALSLLNDDYFRKVGPAGRDTLLECSAEEVRRLYGERYRIYWNVGPWRRLRTLAPCYLMHDDHELFDNFGAAPAHATEKYRAFREGALQASFDYQGRHHICTDGKRPTSMHYTLEYGPLACFMMDIRSQKRAHGDDVSFFDDEQAQDLRDYLHAQSHRPVVAVVCTVPLAFLPDPLASAADRMTSEASDAADRWAHERARRSRDELLSILHQHQQRHPMQKLVLLGGDVHVGLAHELTWEQTGLKGVQLISSGVSNLETRLKLEAARLLPKLMGSFTVGEGSLALRCEMLDGKGDNPVGNLNAGLLSFRREDAQWTVRVRLLANRSEEDPRAYVAFDSRPI